MRIYYKMKRTRKGKSVVVRRKKTVEVHGKILEKPKLGTFTSRFGTKIHGVKIVYLKKIEGGAGLGGRIKQMRVEKLVQLPGNATNVRIK